MKHKATALHVKYFYSKEYASEIGKQLVLQEESGRGRNWEVSTSKDLESSDDLTLGEYSLFNVASSTGDVEGYFEGVQREWCSRRTRTISKYHSVEGLHLRKDQIEEEDQVQVWPLDKLRLELDEVWPNGAGLAK